VTAFLQYIVTGVSDGAAYGLVGIGLVIVFRTTNALNFAQGVYAVIAGLTTSVLSTHMPILLAALIAIALTTSIGVVTGLITIGIRGDTTPLHSLIVTLGLTLIAESAELLIFGDAPHSYASIALARGVHPKVVQEALGHSTIAVTLDLYSHVVPSLQREAAKEMGAALFG